MARIAYYYREMSEYIEIDLRRLREHHAVTVVGAPTRWPRPLATWREVAQADLVMSWFASWHALWPAVCARVLGRPFVLTVGGYDTACLPGIDYGHQRGGLRGIVARAVMALATRIIVISDFTRTELEAMGAPLERGVLIPLGLDPERYPCAAAREPGLVVTVGGVNQSNRTRKGLEPFVRAAALAPECRFVVIGAWMDDAVHALRALAPPNVEFTGRLSHEDKAAWLARAEVVVQASQHEAFGLSLAEGMLAGAVPVVTAAGALPWVAGGTGVVCASQEPAAIAAGVRAARQLGPHAGARARARVLEHFTDERRARALHALVAELTGTGDAPARPPVAHAA
jgi:glycosyltransferase involved in cell wall biosynthesis